MALNLLIILPTNIFPASGGSLTDTFRYIFAGGNLLLSIHFLIGTLIIAVGVVNLLFVIHQKTVYKILSIISFVSVLSAFVNGERFVSSNFAINGISFGMAAGFLLAFILYLVMAMLMYRDIAVQASKN